MSLTYTNYGVCDVSILGIDGQMGVGVAQMRFRTIFRVTPWASGLESLGEIQASVKVGTETTGATHYLGVALPDRATSIEARSSESYVHLTMTISEGQLEALEVLRAGGGLRFSLAVSAVADGKHGLMQMSDEIVFAENLSNWVEVLKQLGGVDHLIVGLPIPRCEPGHPFKNAVERLVKARSALVAGRYDAVVSDCRLAIESAANAAMRFEDMKTTWKLLKDGKQGLSKSQRELLIFESARNYAHLAHHENGDPEVFSRADAHMVLGITVAAIAAFKDMAP